jgi:hypothetical protein
MHRRNDEHATASTPRSGDNYKQIEIGQDIDSWQLRAEAMDGMTYSRSSVSLSLKVDYFQSLQPSFAWMALGRDDSSILGLMEPMESNL